MTSAGGGDGWKGQAHGCESANEKRVKSVGLHLWGHQRVPPQGAALDSRAGGGLTESV
jgi:hypothetical protein